MRATGWTRGLLALGLGGLLIAGCAASLSVKNETPGQRFDREMKVFAENCAKAKLKPNDTACDILKLKPAEPLATEEGRFAHSIKIPNPVPEASGYKSGMTSEQYFEHLCKTEAGEFIYKAVENVEGVYMMRPRKAATDYKLEHLYVLEDPYGDMTEAGGAGDRSTGVFLGSTRYRSVEMPDDDNRSSEGNATVLRRYLGQNERSKKNIVVERPLERQNRYGYTWRGLTRPHDRELGIAGGELLVLDLRTSEVLAVRRGYIRSGNVKNLTGIWWLKGQLCPQGKPGRPDFYTYDFIMDVLKPQAEQSKNSESQNVAK